jgi:peptide/nickel transport system substrate-binding protein
MRQTTTTVQNIVQMMVETLFRVDSDGKVQPYLATSYTNTPDGLSYTLTLRQGVKFTDGTAFDAQAVKANFERVLDTANTVPLRGVLSAISSVDAMDATHVKFTLKNAVATFIPALTQVTFGMVSPKQIEPGSATYKDDEQPIGTGPYVFKERVKGDHVTLARNTSYWGRAPSYDTQVMKIVPEAASREALVRSGQADVILLPPVSDLPAMQHDSSLKVLLAPGDRTIFISIDTTDSSQPLLQKPEVRQALNYAVDKQTIIKSILYGAADPMTAPMAKSLFGYCQTGPYTYNPSKAKQMLAAAGASGLKVKLMAPTGRYIQDFQAAQAVAGNLRDAGVDVDGPHTSDWPTYLATINVPPDKASTDLHLLGWAPGFLDAQGQMEQFLGSARFPPKGLETSYYQNSQVTALIDKANAEPNQSQRESDYCSAEKQIWNDAPWIFLWVQRFPIIYSSKVTGVQAIPNESFYTVYASPA